MIKRYEDAHQILAAEHGGIARTHDSRAEIAAERTKGRVRQNCAVMSYIGVAFHEEPWRFCSVGRQKTDLLLEKRNLKNEN